MADWLLRSHPDRLPEIASCVAADALAQGMTEPWDELVLGSVACLKRADELYSMWSINRYEWKPSKGSLIA